MLGLDECRPSGTMSSKVEIEKYLMSKGFEPLQGHQAGRERSSGKGKMKDLMQFTNGPI